MTEHKPGIEKLLLAEQSGERPPSPQCNQEPFRAWNLRLFKG